MAWSEKVYWLHKIRHNPHINIFLKIKALILVALTEPQDDHFFEKYEYLSWSPVAYGNEGQYYTDYGCGRSWDTIVVKGLKWTIYDDGNL